VFIDIVNNLLPSIDNKRYWNPMIPTACKRLAEVDFPIATVSRHAAREKSIRHGHPSTLHLWWARRPLAACRAMLLGLLLPDPADALCPPAFKTEARAALGRLPGKLGPSDLDLRQALLQFIGDFANWDLAANAQYLAAGRALVRAAHPGETPLVVDPFAGGGSIPLEALRLGCDAFASDLNPVAGLIQKVMLEDIPRHGPGLADELRRVGAEIKAAAEKELAEFYPTDPDGARPIAYLWARTVRCEAEGCGAEIPLMRSFWLSKKAKRKRALRYHVVREAGQTPRLAFEIFEPATDAEVPAATVKRANATCPACSRPASPTVLPASRVRVQLRAQRGGADVIFDEQGRRVGGATLLAMVTSQDDEAGRQYRLPTKADYEVIWRAMQRLATVGAQRLPNGLSAVPDEPTPAGGGSGAGRAFSIKNYGIHEFGDMFTSRQKLMLLTLRTLLATPRSDDMAAAKVLGLALSRLADISNAFCRWENTKTQVRNLFTRQAMSMVWDFAEADPLGKQAGGYSVTLNTMVNVVDELSGRYGSGQVQLADARKSPLPDGAADVWFTDPPYYDAVPYSELSDFFFVWLKRALPESVFVRDPFDAANPLTPKQQEIVQDEVKQSEGRPKDRAFFEGAMAKTFVEGRRVLQENGIGAVVFAHKTTEGWEALLSGMIRGGWVITGSWPIATESSTRPRARDSAALATSVHLVCRPRIGNEIGDWSDVFRALPGRVADWMERLQGHGVRGADLVFACIGPALEIYSRYAQVLDAEDRAIPLGGDPTATEPYQRGYLAYVWEVVARAALEQVLGTDEAKARHGEAGAVEEDARLTALFLWTLQGTDGKSETPKAGQPEADEAEEISPPDDEDEDEAGAPRKKPKGLRLIYDVARRFAQPLGIHLEDWEGRIIETDKGVVRLLPVAERALQLFGADGAGAVTAEMEDSVRRTGQLALFPEEAAPPPKVKGRGRKGRKGAAVSDADLQARREATTLDRVHAAMLLQKSGRTNALRALLQAEQERSPGFLRLANALSALYPRESEEKRLVDAMLLAMPK